MGTFLLILVLIVVAVVAAVVVGGVALARSSKSSFKAANEVVPGTPTRAPAEWAGAHSAEARLHRRLRDAVAAMRANPAMDALAFSEARMMVESEALAVDDRLVAVAALPANQRGDRLGVVAQAVDEIEKVVAEMVDAAASSADTGVALAAVRTRLELVAQARDELSALGSGSQLSDLRDIISAEASEVPGPEPDVVESAQPPEPPPEPPPDAPVDPEPGTEGDETGL